MIDVFPRVFLLVFCQLAVGGMFCLSIPPFHELERGYYKSSAAVYVFVAWLALAGRVALWWAAPDATRTASAVEIALWMVFCISVAGYLASLWSERVALRARLFAASWISGAAALAALAEGYRQAPLLSIETLVFPLSFLVSALLLGAAASGMLLGHWYLIDRDLSLQPLNRTVIVYRRTLAVQAALFLAAAILMALFGAPAARAALRDLLSAQLALFGTRLAVSPFAAAALGWMIRRTLDIPQTMAATGLFYIAVLAVLVGELLGRFVLFRTGLPF
jgi:hypothetical protein